MRFGINLMAWAGTIGPAEIALFPTLAQVGYAGVEIPLLVPDDLDVPAVRGALRDSGLACTISSALPDGASLLVPSERARGIEFLRRCLMIAATLDAEVLCGPLYAPVGRMTGSPRTSEEWHSCIRSLREVARIAEDCGVVLALEPLNRFETYVLNTAADACQLVGEVGSPFVGVLLDTFHMNIEEKDPVSAVIYSGPHLRHVHLSENDRGVVGRGHLPWSDISRALRTIAYKGWLVCETFNGRIPTLAAATAIWRPLFSDPETYARESIRFLRAVFHQEDNGVRDNLPDPRV